MDRSRATALVRMVAFALAALVAVAACDGSARGTSGQAVAAPTIGTTAGPTATPSRTLAPVPTPVPGSGGPLGALVDVGGYGLWVECQGSGLPTVLFEAGLGSGREAWSRIVPRVAETARACAYDRAGIGRSESRPETTTTAGTMADELARLLLAAGIDGPVVLVGHSYGGMVVQLAADRNPGIVGGAVLVDSSSGGQFEEDFSVTNFVWEDGSTVVDKPGTVMELAAVDLGATPLIVLTQDNLDGALGADWARYQAALASLSTGSVHLIATGAGHGIPDEASDLVVAAVEAVVAAVRDGASPPPCTGFAPVGGECFAR